MSNTRPCHWSPTGYAYELPQGGCSCRIAAPPGVVLYEGEIVALEHELATVIAVAVEDDARLAELVDEQLPDHVEMLATATAKLKRVVP